MCPAQARVWLAWPPQALGCCWIACVCFSPNTGFIFSSWEEVSSTCGKCGCLAHPTHVLTVADSKTRVFSLPVWVCEIPWKRYYWPDRDRAWPMGREGGGLLWLTYWCLSSNGWGLFPKEIEEAREWSLGKLSWPGRWLWKTQFVFHRGCAKTRQYPDIVKDPNTDSNCPWKLRPNHLDAQYLQSTHRYSDGKLIIIQILWYLFEFIIINKTVYPWHVLMRLI